jgi:hypothetical protein
MRIALPILLVFVTALSACTPVPSINSNSVASEGDGRLARAFADEESRLQIEGTGTVIKLLDDDNEGSRHQRFIVRLENGQTILIAHNIDLASRIDSLKVGDEVGFFGEYDWSAKGGTIHWTHHDPQGRHVAGWLKHQGRLYQ